MAGWIKMPLGIEVGLGHICPRPPAGRQPGHHGFRLDILCGYRTVVSVSSALEAAVSTD